MNDDALAQLKSILEISSELKFIFSDKDAFLTYFLKVGMRLFCCEKASVISLESNEAENSRFKSENCFIAELFEENRSEHIQFKLINPFIEKKLFETEKPLFLSKSEDNIEYSVLKNNYPGMELKCFLGLSIKTGQNKYVLEFFNKKDCSGFSSGDYEILKLLEEFYSGKIRFSDEAENNFEEKTEEIKSDKNKVCEKKLSEGLTYEFSENDDFERLCEADCMNHELLEEIKLFSEVNSPVLIKGEYGTGKASAAKLIYKKSIRNGKPFLHVNCKSLCEADFEKLFINEEGTLIPSIEKADGGILYIENIEELPLKSQKKVLEIIQNKKILSGNFEYNADLRVIASTCTDIDGMTADNLFDEELFYRLSACSLRIPSLKEQKKYLKLCAYYYLKKFSSETGKNISGFSEEAEKVLMDYQWPGNIPELKSVVFQAVLLSENITIRPADLTICNIKKQNKIEISENIAFDSVELSGDKTLKSALDDFKKAYITKILEENRWNQTKASKILDIQRTYISRLMNELHIRHK